MIIYPSNYTSVKFHKGNHRDALDIFQKKLEGKTIDCMDTCFVYLLFDIICFGYCNHCNLAFRLKWTVLIYYTSNCKSTLVKCEYLCVLNNILAFLW